MRTLYRILAAEDRLRERRNVLQHPQYAKPVLLATARNQLWSWDITKLKGPQKWTYFYLYVIIDVFSRYVVGWMVAPCESAALAKQLTPKTCAKQGIRPGQIILYADCGPSMKSKPVAVPLADLGVTKTHSRPYTSDDNPFSAAHFKNPEVPTRLPGPLWRHPRLPRPLPGLLPVVQQRSSPLGDRLHDPSRIPLRTHPGHHQGPLTDSRHGL